MSGASGGGQLATVSLITALTSITNAVAVSGIAGTVDTTSKGAVFTAQSISIPNVTTMLIKASSVVTRSFMVRNENPGVTVYVGAAGVTGASNGMALNYGEVLIVDNSPYAEIYAYQASGAAITLQRLWEE